MLLTYSHDDFVEKIINGSKKHTIRTDTKKRWKPGISIQHWRGNPRNVYKNPYKFLDGVCDGVEEIVITRDLSHYGVKIEVNAYILAEEAILMLIENDGLDPITFRNWFVPASAPVFEGRIIHFTPLRYDFDLPF